MSSSSSLTLSHIRFAYPGSPEPVLDDVTATFPRGWTGVVGDNGCGKTTLMRIACGLIEPDAGSVSPRLFSRMCEQGCDTPPEGLDDFAADWDQDAVRLRDVLGIGDDWPYRFDELSGGQRKRLHIACALAARPQVLVMDEPTNHLDASGRRAVTKALSRFDGVGVLVSHDRALLDALVERCLCFEAGRWMMRPGTYSQAAGQAGVERESDERRARSARREERRVAAEAARRRQKAEQSHARRSGKNLAAKDSDAREKRMRALVSGQDGKATHLSSLMESRLEKARERTADARVEKRYEGDVWVDAEPARRPVLVRLDAQTVPFDGVAGDAGVRVPDLWVGNQDHIAVTGDNGCGKTTLVRRLVSLLPNDTHTLYVPQEVTAEQAQELRKRLAGLDRARKGQALSMVAQLNSDPERVLDDGPTSPGETRKLALALGALDHPQLIVMDEPTNHLDIGSVTALERVLASFPAALVLVTHDARMVERATSVRWQISRAADGASSRLVVE